jgi:hypothetical protein
MLVDGQDEHWRKESDRAEGTPGFPFWLTWSDIRLHLYKVQHDYPGCEPPRPANDLAWLALERAAKRALHTLVKRGEIGRIRESNGYWYMSAKTYNESFSPQAMKELREAFERFEQSEMAPQSSADPGVR